MAVESFNYFSILLMLIKVAVLEWTIFFKEKDHAHLKISFRSSDQS